MHNLIVVADVILFIFFDVLCIGNLLDDGDPAGVDDLLEVVLLPADILFLLEFEELATLCLVKDCSIDGGRLGCWSAIKVVDAGREAHLSLVQDECKAAMISCPLVGREDARDL